MLKSKTLCEFENGIAFTDLGDRKVKLFCPAEKTVKTSLGSGQEGASDGTDETCSLIYASSWYLFLGEDSFHIGCCCRYHQTSFRTQWYCVVLTSPGKPLWQFWHPSPKHRENRYVSSRCRKQSIACEWQHYEGRFWSETKVRTVWRKPQQPTNGPEGTVSKKTQVSLNLLEQGMRRLHHSITTINKDYLDDVELCT